MGKPVVVILSYALSIVEGEAKNPSSGDCGACSERSEEAGLSLLRLRLATAVLPRNDTTDACHCEQSEAILSPFC